jgi:hypothetical protein
MAASLGRAFHAKHYEPDLRQPIFSEKQDWRRRLKRRRTNMGIWIPARINRALRAAIEWASDPDIGIERVRRGAVLCALIVTCAALLGSRVLGRLVPRTRAIVILGLALAILVGALEYRSHPGMRTTDAPVPFGPAPARVTEYEPARGGKNESVEENARMAEWKRSVEQALLAAKAREQHRQQDAATAEDGVDATAAWNIAAQEGEATWIDLGIARELAKKQAETLNARNEDKAAAETKAASGSSAVKEANAANDAKRANETKGSEPFSDSFPTAGGQDERTGSTTRMNGWSRRTEINRAAKETVPEVARKNAIARHALTYSWVTTDGAGHRWVHIRPIQYSQRE